VLRSTDEHMTTTADHDFSPDRRSFPTLRERIGFLLSSLTGRIR